VGSRIRENRIRVYILNPAEGSKWTSYRSASKYVHDGRARFTDPPNGYEFAIEFIKDKAGRDVLVAHLEKVKRIQFDRGYDSRTSPMRRNELAALPFANLSAENYTRLISLQTKRSRA